MLKLCASMDLAYTVIMFKCDCERLDISEAIIQRKSIRALKPDPVPPDILKKILEESIRAPSLLFSIVAAAINCRLDFR